PTPSLEPATSATASPTAPPPPPTWAGRRRSTSPRACATRLPGSPSSAVTSAPIVRPATSPGAVPLPAALEQVAERVERRDTEPPDAETARWAAIDDGLLEPLEAVRALVMAGGKRLRPAFCHWGFVAAGGQPDDPAVTDAGAAFELLQAFALIHDDVMDGSAV